MKVEIECTYCKNKILRYIYRISNTNFCSRKCKKEYQKSPEWLESQWTDECRKKVSNSVSGTNNPNYGNQWNLEQREAMTERLIKFNKEIGEDGRKERYGKSNRGLTRSPEYIANWHKDSIDSDYEKQRQPKSIITKNKIAKTSRDKFTPEYKEQQRKTMEATGKWLPRSDQQGFKGYDIDANWCRKMWDIVILPDDFNQVGIYNSHDNTTGYCRDHILSKVDGFKEKVFPQILRHPCNCDIISHSENSSKSSNSHHGIDHLFELIESYTGEWFEQEICLELIKRYRNNERWCFNE